ncbi:MAG TPA: hypothetical protein VM432_11085 [Bdellovibrionales bacterium]|nr:hypothetical protein [Bdellovibrionales bacterium]
MKNLLSLVLVLAAAVANAGIDPTPQQDAKYRKLYPLFIDACSAGLRVTRPDNKGQPWGHGALLIRGAELDLSQGYPRLRVKTRGPGNEVGVSADGQFNNINWVGVPGEKLFFYGDLDSRAKLTNDVRNALIERMIKTGWFSMVQSDRWTMARDRDEEMQMILNEAIPIDVAMAWGRETLCQRIPVNEKQLQSVVEYLNRVNHYYFVEGHKYTWDFLTNSCGHLANNGMHAAGVVEEKKVDQKGLEKFFNISIPTNFFLHAVRDTSSEKFPSFKKLIDDDEEVETFMRFGMIPAQDGALTRRLRPHGYDNPALNEVYDPRASKSQYLDIHLFKSNNSLVRKFTTDASYSDLKPNLEKFLAIYRKNLANAEKLNLQDLEMDNEVRSYTLDQVHAAYINYLRTKIKDVESKLAQL